MKKVQRDTWKIGDVLSDNDWADEKHDEQNQQGEVKDSISDDSPPSKLRLLDRIDWGTDLTTVDRLARVEMMEEANIPWSKPEEHYRVEFVDVWDAERRQHDEHDEVAQQEVRSEETKLGDLAEELSSGL